MRRPNVLSLIWLGLLIPACISTVENQALQKRQGVIDSALPTITSIAGGASPSTTDNSATTKPSRTSLSISTSTSPPSESQSSASTSNGSSHPSSTTDTESNNSDTHSESPAAAAASSSSTITPALDAHNSTTTATSVPRTPVVLPLKPEITPALSIAGVLLILTGCLYALVGVKNRWIQIFLSTAYLTSLSITVLIDYVMNPPVSNAIQGAYFVGIFMTGVIFGGGALIFKEVTEGLGCLFGGFCLSMWLLTLKPGGLLTSSAGKGIFIAIFCVLTWCLSFSHYTRVYGLIGSTSFGGATAFVIGIDCFSRAGLKEFWFYIWDLNEDLFPLNTNTYPITRGIRVEIVVMVLGCAVGIMSQVKLWKVIRDQQKRRDAEREEDSRRTNAVEEALGRHLQRQNDRDRSHWEKQYGDRLQSKRSTVLWADTHPEKRYSQIMEQEVLPQSQGSSSTDSLEMSTIPRRPPSKSYGSKNKRSSVAVVEVIPEERESLDRRASMERMRALHALGESGSINETLGDEGSESGLQSPKIIPLPFKVPQSTEGTYSDEVSTTRSKQRTPTTTPPKPSKRKSLQSMLTLTPRRSIDQASFSESQEALILPGFHHSRASSVAATFDEENDTIEIASLQGMSTAEAPTPQIIISPAVVKESLLTVQPVLDEREFPIREAAPSPPTLNDDEEFDPEALARPASRATILQESTETIQPKEWKSIVGRAMAPSSATEQYEPSQKSVSQSSSNDGLTQGALAQVPSQLSNVVMSYRTNEWAKHISVADEPVYDEPQNIESDVYEAPVQLALPTSPTSSMGTGKSTGNIRSLDVSSRPPPLHVVSTITEVGVAANVRPNVQRQLSDPSSHQQATPISSDVVRTNSTQSNKSSTKNRRQSLNGITMMPCLEETPVEEIGPLNSALQPAPRRRSTIGFPSQVDSTFSLPGSKLQNNPHASRPTTSSNTPSNPVHRSISYNMLNHGLNRTSSYDIANQSFSGQNPRMSIVDSHARPGSAMSGRPGMRSDSRLDTYNSSRPESAMSGRLAMRSESRLDAYNNVGLDGMLNGRLGMLSDTRIDSYESRQPQKRKQDQESQRREALLAEWKISQAQGVNKVVLPQTQVDTRRAQMLLDREHQKLLIDQQRAHQQHQQNVVDHVMRRPDMQDLHREAMRKMQANANKNV